MYFIPCLAHASFLIDGSTYVFMNHVSSGAKVKKKCHKILPSQSQKSDLKN